MTRVKNRRRVYFLAFYFLVFLSGVVNAVDNPLKVSLDGAMVRYNGLYYGMAARTNGQMLVSSDLLTWDAPIAVLPKNVQGPYELIYRNGLFYLFAQGRGFGVSADPLVPFSAIQKSGISGEQMRLYQDGSGALFSVNRRFGSKKESEIWLQRYGAPWKPVDKPSRLLDGRLGTWDSLDSADLGEPEVLQYRGNYYLLYAANHASPRTGLREVGVAVNENPLRFDNTDKKNDPILTRNAERLARTYSTILPSGEYASWNGQYTTKAPAGGWTKPGFKLSGWRAGKGGFGYPFEVDGAQLHACRTEWQSDRIWVRREFDLTDGIPKALILNIRHEGAVQVFINGKKVYESSDPAISYSNFDISEAAAGVFRGEDNVIAVQARAVQGGEYRFLDFGLFDAGDAPLEPTVYGLNAPRIITGPNGFEKWITYRAWWNGVPGSGLDRVFFFDKELVVDGPTTAETSGYHPPPAQPTFSDSFSQEENSSWDFAEGAWAITNGVLRQSGGKGVAKAYIKQRPATHYLFETNIRFPKDGKGDVGVVAWSDGEKDMVISINPSKRTWGYHIEPSQLTPKRIRLPKGFQIFEKPPGANKVSAPLHRLRITKNGGHFSVSLDAINLRPEKPIITQLSGSGVPGLYCMNATAEFDGVTFTVGWDEHDEYITGWGSARDGTLPGGDWSHHRDLGLEQRKHSETGRAFKGDWLDRYEFTVNVQTEKLEEGKSRLYGVFPVFVDRNNYLKAMIDTRARQLVVTGMRDGKPIKAVARSLKHRIPHRHLYDKTTAYRDVSSWVYSLRSESIISALDIRWMEGENDHLQQEFQIPSDDILVRYARLKLGREPNLWEDGCFYDAAETNPSTQQRGVLNPISFRTEIGNYIGFGFYVPSSVVIDSVTGRFLRFFIPWLPLLPGEEMSDDTIETDTLSRPQETLVTVEVESSYFFRCIKLSDRVIIELNGRPVAMVEGEWPASQVGLVTEGQPCFFNGITLMHLPTE